MVNCVFVGSMRKLEIVGSLMVILAITERDTV